METAKEEWLTTLNSAAVKRQVEKAKWEERDKILTQYQATLERCRGELFDVMNVTIHDDESAVGEKDKDHQQKALDYFTRDQTKEFDWAEQFEGWNVLSDDDWVKHARAEDLINSLSDPLVNAKIEVENPPGSGIMEEVDLFDEDDLQNEFYTPLVREGLLSETFVPNEFSRTEKMIKGTFDHYKERLEEDGYSRLGKAKDYAGLGLSFVSAGAQFAGGVLTIDDAAKLDPKDVKWSKFAVFKSGSDDTDWIKSLGEKDKAEIVDAIGNGLSFVSDICLEGYSDVKERIKGKYENAPGALAASDRRKLFGPRIADSLIAAAVAVVSDELNRWDIGVAAASVFRSTVDAKAIITVIMTDVDEEEENDKLDASHGSTIAEKLAAGFKGVLDFCPGEGRALADTAARTMATTFDGIDKGVLATKINDADIAAAMKVVSDQTKAAIEEAFKSQEFCQMMQQSRASLVKDLGQKMADDFAERMGAVEEQQREEWERCKNDPRANLNLIEKKIQEINQRRQALKWAKNMSSMGISVASKFFAPLAIAGSAISLMENLTECVIRVRDSIQFFDSQIDMFRDASPYSAPIANFVHNAEVQAIHYEIQATCDLISMIGAIVETVGYASGPGAAAAVAIGKTMQGTSDAVSALESVMYDIQQRLDARTGWQKYKEALLKPENRKLALIAMKKNPTLAKYAVAWGAIIEKDVLVSDFLTVTGLSIEALQEPGAKVGQVVSYLEARMPDDNVITGVEAVAKGWAPAPKLTLECWIAALRRGEKEAKLVLSESESQAKEVELAILAYQRSWTPVEQRAEGTDPTEEQVSTCLDDLGSLDSAFGSYRPKRKITHLLKADELIRHAEMEDFVSSLRGLVKQRETWLTKRAWEQDGEEED